jgi:hypothetical protein
MSAQTAATTDPQTSTTTDAPTYSLALEEARRALDLQVDQMETVRSRALQVLGGASIAASVFGGLVIRRGEPLQLVLGGLAVAAFVVLAVFGMLVLKSRPVTLAVKPLVLVQWVETPHVTQSWMERKLALELGATYDANLEKIDPMYQNLNWSLVALLVELATFVAAFALSMF